MTSAIKSTEPSLPPYSGKSQRFKPVHVLNRDACKKNEGRNIASESKDPRPWLKPGQGLQANKWKELNSAKIPNELKGIYICLQNHKQANKPKHLNTLTSA